MAELKRCPFCGGEEIIIRPVQYAGLLRSRFYVQCRDCFARQGDYFTKSGAADAWNRRVSDG